MLDDAPACYVITGVMAAGKSTVAEALASRFRRAAHVRGDAFRRMIVAGRDPIAPTLGEEALRQLRLRWRLASTVADAYWRDGFTVVLQDVYAGPSLELVVDRLVASPLHVVALVPSADAVRERERTRAKSGYTGGWDVDAHLAAFHDETPRLGLWLDTSNDTPGETVAAILARRGEARVR